MTKGPPATFRYLPIPSRYPPDTFRYLPIPSRYLPSTLPIPSLYPPDTKGKRTSRPRSRFGSFVAFSPCTPSGPIPVLGCFCVLGFVPPQPLYLFCAHFGPPPLSPPQVLGPFCAHSAPSSSVPLSPVRIFGSFVVFPPCSPSGPGAILCSFWFFPPAFSNKLLSLNSLSPSLSRVCGVCVLLSPPGGESLRGNVFPNPNFLWGFRPEAHTHPQTLLGLCT